MDLGYWLYMSEAEGQDDMVDTRLAKLNAIGKDLRDLGYAGDVPLPTEVFQLVCLNHGITHISDAEFLDIQRRWL